MHIFISLFLVPDVQTQPRFLPCCGSLLLLQTRWRGFWICRPCFSIFLGSCLHCPLSLFFCPSLRFLRLGRCLCVSGTGKVLCYRAAQCDSTVRSLTHSWAWSRPVRPERREVNRRACGFTFSQGIWESSDKCDVNWQILGFSAEANKGHSFFFFLEWHNNKYFTQNNWLFMIGCCHSFDSLKRTNN